MVSTMPEFRLWHVLLAALFVVCLARQFLSASNNVATPLDYGMFEWVNSAEDGHCSHKQQVRHIVPDDPHSPLGVFATELIGKGEVLCTIPSDRLIQSVSSNPDYVPKRVNCEIVERLAREMELDLDGKSMYGPYMKYLNEQASASSSLVPSGWSEDGKDFLEKILGINKDHDYHHDDGLDEATFWHDEYGNIINVGLIPPVAPINWMEIWEEDCGDYDWFGDIQNEDGDKDDDDDDDDDDFFADGMESHGMFSAVETAAFPNANRHQEQYHRPSISTIKKALFMVLMRSDDAIMVPVYSFYNHRNGKWTNADTYISKYHHQTRATRTIRPGEQVHISYNQCHSCDLRMDDYGTAEIFRDYGFVEQMPQRWHYLDDRIHFDVDINEQGEVHVVRWLEQDDVGKELTATTSKATKNKKGDDADIKALEEKEDEIEYSIGWLHDQMIRLDEIRHDDMLNEYDIPKHEWNTAWQFYESNLAAMSAAIHFLQERQLVLQERRQQVLQKKHRQRTTTHEKDGKHMMTNDWATKTTTNNDDSDHDAHIASPSIFFVRPKLKSAKIATAILSQTQQTVGGGRHILPFRGTWNQNLQIGPVDTSSVNKSSPTKKRLRGKSDATVH